MQQSAPSSPDKPVGNIKYVARSILRRIRWAIVKFKNYNKIKHGDNCYFGRNADFYVPESFLMGNNISIAANFISQTNVVINDNCLISSNVSLVGNDHDILNPSNNAYSSGRLRPSTIVLEGNNFIGFGATLLGDIVIGKNSVIAAGALVNRSVPRNKIVAGVPAKIIGEREYIEEKL